jgi:hypothetical protein
MPCTVMNCYKSSQLETIQDNSSQLVHNTRTFFIVAIHQFAATILKIYFNVCGLLVC